MAKQIVYGKLICKCERCSNVWMAKDVSQVPRTCSTCRSAYWDVPRKVKTAYITTARKDHVSIEDLIKVEPPKIEKPKIVKKDPVVLTDEKQMEAKALQCALVYKFDCGYYRQKIPASALCKVCFKSDFWNRPKTLQVLLDMTKEDVEDIDEPDITLEPLLADTVEDTEIVGGQPPTVDEKKLFELKARGCMEKYKDVNGDWYCNFFVYRDHPPYDYCKRCWELPAIWGSKAVGYKGEDDE